MKFAHYKINSSHYFFIHIGKIKFTFAIER